FGNLHLAVLRNIPSAEADDGPAQTNLDARLSNIGVGVGELEVVLLYGTAGKRGHASGDELWEPLAGSQIGLIHSVPVAGGFNRAVLQYGQGLYGARADWRSSLLSQYGAWGSQN